MSNSLIEKVSQIQANLKAPKGQYNKFGGYNYRSCEDILEAVKPMLAEKGLILTITDEISQIGDRYYVKSTATITDGENSVINSAFAREAEAKKGMDESQITGATSSYARKYALNGLFCIDDTKDADATNTEIDNLKNEIKSEKAKATRELNKQVAEYNKSDEGLEERYKGIYAIVKKMKDINPYGRDKILMEKVNGILDELYGAKKNVAYDALNKLVNEKMIKEEPDEIPVDICQKGVNPVDYLNAG